MSPPLIPILIPAAGASMRMLGADKLLEPVAGNVPLLAERIATARATGQPVLVALPPRASAPGRWVLVEGAEAVEVKGVAPGMGASLAALARALPKTAQGALILPADMPDISLNDLKNLLQAFDGKHIYRGASKNGQPGHPVLFTRKSFADLRALQGDLGARSLLKNAETRLIALPGNHALTDLDTPEQWAAWRQKRQAR